MSEENDLTQLLKTMQPQLQTGDYVFCTVSDLAVINIADVLMTFKEQEGITLILKKDIADHLSLSYSYIAAWITLTVHSSLEAVGLTAAFAKALSNANISCNVVAAFYHDHIFVAKADSDKAMQVLYSLSKG
jgi:uncharacterized protein